MSDLSPRSRAIIDSAGDADGPSATDKARVRAALFAQIGIAGAASTAGAATPAAGGSGGPSSTLNIIAESNSVSGLATSSAGSAGGLAGAAAKALVGIAIAGSVGLGGYFVAAGDQSETKPSIQAPAIVEMALPSPETATISEPPEPALTPAPVASAEPEKPEPAVELSKPRPRKKPARAARKPRKLQSAETPPGDDHTATQRPESSPRSSPDSSGDGSSNALASLRQEHRLIRGAKRALDQDNPALALQLLTEHAESFASGQLVQERSALRLVALCKLGRHPRAERERAKFQARWPKSPHNATIGIACGKD